ncbi:MAG: sulfurtransferase TusA family protein [bacterium]
MERDLTLDTLGLYCPMPIIKASQEIFNIEVGQVLEVIADDEGIKKDMPDWCRNTGHEFLGIEEEDDEIRVYVRRTI